MTERDVVVLLADDATPIGTAPRETVHTQDTPLHLGFSCYLFGPDGRLLITRRALTKRSWPGVWTNSFCGHPRPDEPMPEAVTRHARHELGVSVEDVSCVLPEFRYRAVDASGVLENEVCPVYIATTSQEPDPNPAEVIEHRWVDANDAASAARTTPWALSPWMVKQVEHLILAGRLGEGHLP